VAFARRPYRCVKVQPMSMSYPPTANLNRRPPYASHGDRIHCPNHAQRRASLSSSGRGLLGGVRLSRGRWPQ
jgi:hypothetical protein